jgi:hypothetical protein
LIPIKFGTLKPLLSGVVRQGKVSLDDPVEKVKSKVFKRVSLDTELGVLNTILETENFALVVNTHTICKSSFFATVSYISGHRTDSLEKSQ